MLILTKAFISIIQIFLITTAGYIFFRIRTFKQLYRPLLFYTVNFALPVLIIYRLITKFNFELFLQTLSLPLYGAFLIFWGYFVGKQLVPHMNLRAEKKNIFISLMMFSNIGYLPLPLFESVFQGDDIALAQIYVFFIALVYTSLIWSVGVNMLRHREGVFQRTKFKVTAPFVALLSGVALSFLDLKTYITGPVESVIKSVGTSGVYLVMFIMGGGLSSVKLAHIKIDKPVLTLTFFKMFLLPLLVIPFVFLIKMDPVLRTVFLVEAGVPPAVNLVIITQKYGKGKNIDFLLSSMILTNLVSIVTISLLIYIAR